MKILMVYPEYPDTFWSYRHALKFVSKKSTHPPLGLLTVGAMLSRDWELRLIDMNVENLKYDDIKEADYVFISAMVVQKQSAKKIINKCNELGTKIVAGGPLFTAEYEEFESVDHFVLDEAEKSLPPFLEDLKNGCPKHIYRANGYPDLEKTPSPNWSLLNMKKYQSMNLQYSRGCPFNCEFCNITALFGRQVRTKNKDQMVKELDDLYNKGWRGGVFIVDDNFIGNKTKLKEDVLPSMINWMEKHNHPFFFSTEASINLADDEELMRLMVEAGFNMVFVGIETPNEESLAECNKFQNKNRDLVMCIKKMQRAGLQVTGGFIVGFDSDPPSIFEKQIEFIQNSGIVTAMVGLLNAPRGTRLYKRLQEEGRILKDFTGNNTDFSINFIPKINHETLLAGYKNIIDGIYSPQPYYERVKRFLKDYQPLQKRAFHFHYRYLEALVKSIWLLGIRDRARKYYWKLFFWSLFKQPRLFPLAITYLIHGFHFRKVFNSQ